jgi:hypothetical protein
MTATYEKIATNTVSTSVSSVTFSSIPATYTDLVLITTIKVSTVNDIRLRFNSDTGSNYSFTYLSGNGTNTYSGRDSNITGLQIDAYGAPDNNNNSNAIVHIQNYSNTTTYKTALARANNAGLGLDAVVGMWRSTSAINSIVLIPASGATISAGSIQTLYGIKAE